MITELLNDEESVERYELYKSLSIGQPAPDISWETEDIGVTTAMSLSTLGPSEKYLVFFWSSTCSHCLKEIPELKKFLDSSEECNLQVLAVGLEDHSQRWKKEIANYPEFTHILGLGKWENEIGKRYNISSTPTYFVLDADKKIMAKPEDLEALKKVLGEMH